jgi:integrase
MPPAPLATRAGARPAAAYLARLTSPASVRTMEGSMRVLARLAGYPADLSPLDLPWEQLDYERALALRSALARTYPPRSANKHLTCLRGVLLECWRTGLLGREAMERLRDLPPIKGSRVARGRALSVGELNQLVRAADERTALAILLAAYCGLRRSELVVLTLADVDVAARTLRVLGKGNKERMMPLPAGVVPWLHRWLAVRGSAPGFLLCEGSRGTAPIGGRTYSPERGLTEQSVYRTFAAAAVAAGVQQFAPHDLRRTYVTELLSHGTDAILASKLAGHASVQTTLTYDKRGTAAGAKAVEVLEVPLLDDDEVDDGDDE